MKCSIVIALALTFATSAWLAGQQPAGDKPSAKVLQLEVYKVPPADIKKQFDYYPSGHTAIRALLSLPAKQILAVDVKASTLKSLTDDKGTDLTKAPQGEYSPPWLNSYDTSMSKDKKHLTVRMQAPGTPVEGANKITLKADIVVVCGVEEKTAEAKDVELKVDKTAKIGSLILSTEKGFGGNNTLVNFTCEDAPRVKSVTFLDKDGQALKSYHNGNNANPGVGRNDWICRYSIDGKIDKATVRVIYFEKVENVTVPVNVQVGVGF